MAFQRTSVRLTTPSFLLALILVSASVAPAIARDAPAPGRAALGGSAVRMERPAARSGDLGSTGSAATPSSDIRRSQVGGTEPSPLLRPPTPNVPVARPVMVAKAPTTAPEHASARSAVTTFAGHDHVWIPTLGVSRAVSFFACSSTAYPGDRVYRWGCAGSNNVYLFGHAGSVFAALHDAYVAGRLHRGMALYYAGGDGVVHRYTVRWWKVTTPDNGAWAYASQPTPSLTLQTCVGVQSQYRLVVRLVRTD